MNELTLHPHVYATGRSKGLISILERMWVQEQSVGRGTFYIISAFANYNGGVRFFPIFQNHIAQGGRIIAVFGGSTSQSLTSRQIVQECLNCGVEVYIINRKRLMHAKSYGSHNSDGEMLVVTSANFTGPGMSQNVEMALLLDRSSTKELGFSWEDMLSSMLSQSWNIYQPSLNDLDAPVWKLLYDEEASTVAIEKTDEVTMILRLGHADTARIMANPGTNAGKGTQYFWLSKDCYDFFPALTIPNERGYKRTFSTLVNVHFIDLGREKECRVTFEAENNLDFRLGTAPLRYTKLAKEGDIAAISRVGEYSYELRLYRPGSTKYNALSPYAIHFIGNRGKRYGFMSNQEFQTTINELLSK